MRRLVEVAMLAMLVISGCSGDRTNTEVLHSPVAPGKALSTFEIEEGFKIELIAAEPLIADPVAMEIDENGNMYVVENHGYPLGNKRGSKVKLLRDTNGDGVMDMSTTFADTLMMPTGVMRWKNGILVTDAPDVLYMEDIDKDGKADVIEPLLTGFALSNPQHNVNTPILGLDNWIYIAHERTVGTEVYKDQFGDLGKEILFPREASGPRLPRNANGRNVRMRPDSHELEMLSATTQYGHSFDEWGNYFLANNSNHAMHSVLPAEYVDRNPRLLVPRSTNSLSDHGNAAEVFPITRNRDRQLLTDVGVMTSACGITAYTGGAFPDEFNSMTTFIAEPVSNIVHADRLVPRGSSFTAGRTHLKKEFLASTDMWFRPVNMYVGPDGALYIVDYYREIIEHPEWLSDEVINSGKLYNGRDMGRIYRVSAANSKQPDWTTALSLGGATERTLVQKLSDANLWWRRNAQRLLIDRKAQSAVPELVALAKKGTSPYGRLHALWTLEGLGALKAEGIEHALRDTEAGVRVNAIKLAELHLRTQPSLARTLISMRNDNDPKVRFQLLCTLGFIDSDEAAAARHEILFRDVHDEFVQVAALSAQSLQPEPLLDLAIRRYEPALPAYGSLVENLAAMAARGGQRHGYALIRKATVPLSPDSVSWQVPVLKGLAKGFSGKQVLPKQEQEILFHAFFEHPALKIKQATLDLLHACKPLKGNSIEASLRKARDIAANNKAPERERSLAVDFLALDNPAPHAPLLRKLILSQQPLPVQLAAIRTLNAIPDETVTDFVLANWTQLTPPVQDAALNTFLDKEVRARKLIDALQSGKIDPSTVGWQRSIRLMTQRNIELRNRARAFFVKDDKRKAAIEEYASALELRGNADRGKQIYLKACAICHQVKGQNGIPFGPDLGTIRSWPASGILANIINPNQSIAYGFDLWNVGLKTGESLQGIITSETPSSLTLRNANGQVTTVSRDDIASQKALNMSAMPVGLEKNITYQEMADLLEYLRNGE